MADEVERQAAAAQEGQQLIDVAYKLEDLVGMPEGYDPDDAVNRLKEILDGKLEERMCGALMNWEYDDEQGLLRAQVAADSLDTVTGCLREAADELSDAANLDAEHAAEAARLEQEGKIVSPDRTSFEIDLDEAHIPPDGRAEAWRELREAFSKTALAPCAQVDLVDGKTLKVQVHTDDAEAVNEAARELAELSRQEGAGTAVEMACDKISLTKKVNIRCRNPARPAKHPTACLQKFTAMAPMLTPPRTAGQRSLPTSCRILLISCNSTSRIISTSITQPTRMRPCSMIWSPLRPMCPGLRSSCTPL